MYTVYLITNNINGKRYVGITSRNYLERYKEHINEAINGSKTILHNAIRKYGKDNFNIIILESNISYEEASDKEQYYISKYNTYYTSGIGYNMTIGGNGTVGYHFTEADKSKISESLKGHKFPESRNLKIKEAMTGREYKPEWREALSKSRLGRFKGEENPFYGKKHSDQTKSIVSAKNTKHHILQIDVNTNQIIQEFHNSLAAGIWVVENGYSTAKPTTCEGRISEVCRNNNDACTAYTFKWKFKEKSID